MELIPEIANNEIREGIAHLKKEFLLPVELKDNRSTNGEPPLKKFKNTGDGRKKRAKIHRTPQNEKLCRSYWQGMVASENKLCSFEKCRFSHDVKSYLDNKPPDLGDICHNYETFGFCPFGVTCRYGKIHIESLISLSDEDKKDKFLANPPVLNALTKEVQFALWKKKYDFTAAEKSIKQVDNAFATINGSNKNHKEEKDQISEEGNTIPISIGSCNEDSVKLGPVSDEDLIKLRKSEKKTICWQDQLYLAPLTTLGNLPFRRVCKSYGVDITCGEMALATNLLQGSASEWALVKRHESENCFGIQLCGSSIVAMTKCAQLIQETTNVDFIDINMGCPMDLIFNEGSGSALMRRVSCVEKMVTSMNKVLHIPLTLKMRSGIFAAKNIAHEIIDKAKLWDINMVTVHGRSKSQRYVKQADWNYINECAIKADPLPLFGGGDVFTYADYERQKRETCVAGIMIGRGALIKPWIFTEIKEKREWDISSSERLDILKKFVNYGLEHWGSDSEGIERTRRFLLEWLSFLHRYIPIGLLERAQSFNQRPEPYFGRNDLETLFASDNVDDWIEISEMLLGKVPKYFNFLPKHRANSWKFF